MPEVGAFHDPSGAGLQGESIRADDSLTAEFVEELAGHSIVEASIEVGRDLLGQPDAEPVLEPAKLCRRGPEEG